MSVDEAGPGGCRDKELHSQGRRTRGGGGGGRHHSQYSVVAGLDWGPGLSHFMTTSSSSSVMMESVIKIFGQIFSSLQSPPVWVDQILNKRKTRIFDNFDNN